MTHQLNSRNNEHLEFMDELIQEAKMRLSSCYDHCMCMTEDQYPEVYSLRGIFQNIKAILSEVDKGIQGGYVSQGYFFEKVESLTRDLELLAEAHHGNVSTDFSTRVVEFKE